MFFVLLLILAWNSSNGAKYSDEYKLEAHLFRNYKPHIRPVLKSSDAILVNVSVLTLNLVRFDEDRGIATLNLFCRKQWRDQLLSWSPSQFGGVRSLQVPMKMVWKPDLVVISGSDPKYEYVHQPLAVIQHTGAVRFSVHTQVSIYCRLNYVGFPYDTHTCDLVYEPWSYDTRQVDLMLHPGGWQKNAALNANAEWVITGMKGARTTSLVGNGMHYARIYYRFSLRRTRPLLYFYLVSPAVALAFLLPFILLLRPCKSERLILAFLLLLALFLLLLVQWEVTPKHVASVSWSMKFHMVLWVLCSIVIIWSVLAAGIWERPSVPPPSSWLQTVFLRSLAPVLLLPIRLKPHNLSTTRMPKQNGHQPQRVSFVRIEDEVESQLDALEANSMTPILPIIEEDSANATGTLSSTHTSCAPCAPPHPSSSSGDGLRTEVSDSGVGWKLRHANQQTIPSQWQLIVLCIDRILFLSMSIICAVSASTCYARL